MIIIKKCLITLDPKHIPQLERILAVNSVLKFADNGILCLRRTMLNDYVIFHQTISLKRMIVCYCDYYSPDI